MTEEFAKLLQDLGGAMYRQIVADMAGQPWTSAVLDARYATGGESWQARLRVTTDDPQPTKLAVADELGGILTALGSQRRLFANQWHGLLLTQGADRNCKLTFNVDPACAQDPAFLND